MAIKRNLMVGSDVHLADRIEHVALQMLDLVNLGELASIVGREILIELPQSKH